MVHQSIYLGKPFKSGHGMYINVYTLYIHVYTFVKWYMIVYTCTYTYIPYTYNYMHCKYLDTYIPFTYTNIHGIYSGMYIP